MYAIFSDVDREEYLIGHIPYRLQSLRFCYRVCKQAMDHHTDYGNELWIGKCLALDDDNSLFINPIVESGLVYSRVLLAFLGIGRQHKTGDLKQIASKKHDDICIRDFDLPWVTVRQAVSGFSYASPTDVEFALSRVIETANKTVAHLTTGPSASGTFPILRTTCRVVIDLVCRHLYAPLGKHSLVPPVVKSLLAE